MFIKFKDGVVVDEITTKLIDSINLLDANEVWDSEDVISTWVITDDELYDASNSSEEEDDNGDEYDDDIKFKSLDEIDGVNLCTIIVDIPNADYSLVLTQDEDDEDTWYIAKCNCPEDDLRVIEEQYEIDKSSTII